MSNQNGLEYEHIRIAEVLLDIIHSDRDNNITYKELSNAIDGAVHPEQLGGYLGVLSNLCLELGLPRISVMVVNGDTRMPGKGFFKYYFPKSKADDEPVLFVKCYNELQEAEDNGEWKKLEDYLNICRDEDEDNDYLSLEEFIEELLKTDIGECRSFTSYDENDKEYTTYITKTRWFETVIYILGGSDDTETIVSDDIQDNDEREALYELMGRYAEFFYSESLVYQFNDTYKVQISTNMDGANREDNFEYNSADNN